MSNQIISKSCIPVGAVVRIIAQQQQRRVSLPFHYELFHPRTGEAWAIRPKDPSYIYSVRESQKPTKKNKKEVQFSDHESARCPRRASGCAETQSSLSRSVSDLHLNSNESGVKLHIGAFVSGLKITRMFVTEPSPRIVSCWACFVGVGPRRRRSVQDLPVLKAKVWSDALRWLAPCVLSRDVRRNPAHSESAPLSGVYGSYPVGSTLSVLICWRFWIFYRFIWVT